MEPTTEVSREAPKKKAKKRYTSIDSAMEKLAMGDEPNWHGVSLKDEDYRLKLLHALNWATTNFDKSMLKKIALEYFEGSEEHEFLKGCPEYHFIGGIGPQAWLRLNKAPVTEESDKFFKDIIEDVRKRYALELQTEIQQKEIDKDIAPQLTVEQQSKIEYATIGAVLDNMILRDEIEEDRVYEVIRSHSPSQSSARMLLERYKENMEDCDNDRSKLNAATKKYNNNLRSGSQKIVHVIEKILNNVRAENKLKVRKLRKRRVKPAQMQVKNLKFKETDISLKLVSIPPTAVISAPTLITFNTKTRKVAIYYAKNADGLSVKGTTVLNHDSEKSKQKLLRKPEQIIDHLIGTSLHRFEKVFEGIKSKQSIPTGRINEDTLLLKVFK